MGLPCGISNDIFQNAEKRRALVGHWKVSPGRRAAKWPCFQGDSVALNGCRSKYTALNGAKGLCLMPAS